MSAKIPAPPRHPGQVLRSYLMGVPVYEVAVLLGIPANQVSAIFEGERPITPEFGDRLDSELKTAPGLWLRMQALWDQYQLAALE